MINEENAKWFCCEDISKIYGYAEAVADKKRVWHCHHCLGLAYTPEQLKAKGLYYKRPASELMFVTKSQHRMLHCLTNPPKHTEKTREKISRVLTNNTKISKRVRQYTKSGEFVAEYPSLMEIKRTKGYQFSHISDCCNGKLKTAYGFVWRFAE